VSSFLIESNGQITEGGKREHAKAKEKGRVMRDGTKRRESQGLRGEPAKVSTHEGGKERITSDSVARTPRRCQRPAQFRPTCHGPDGSTLHPFPSIVVTTKE